MLRIFHNTSYDFIKWWRPSLVIRAIFIAIGLTMLAVQGIHWSIEFTGGTVMHVQFRTPPGDAAVRDAVADAGFPGAQIQRFGAPTDYVIRAQLQGRETQDNARQTREAIEGTLRSRFGDTSHVSVQRAEFVGPTVGAELRRNAFIAMLIAFAVTLIYLAIRFEWRFAVAAVLANMHEIFATFAFLSIMQLEFSLTVLAALLTVIGYSLNDTIIIFDRVRENLKKQRKESLYDIVNRSINETLPRSVMTHVTVLAASLSLLVFAGPILRPFSWIMTFGVITATFTSIYVSGALLLWIAHTWPREAGDKSSTVVAEPRQAKRQPKSTVAR